MARLVHRATGSVVNVPDEKAPRMYAMGYDVVDESKPAKKAASSKSDNK